MSYYDALIAAWDNGATALPAGAAGALFAQGDTTGRKLAKINAWTVTGPAEDVPVASVEGYLSLAGVLTAIEDWLATSPAAGVARTAAKELLRTVASPHVDMFQMSSANVYAQVEGMLSALAVSPPALLTAQQVSDLLALASTATPWWQTKGYTSAFNDHDLAAAGNLA